MKQLIKMQNNRSTQKIKKTNFYYLMRDILSCFPNNIGDNLINTLNNHFISQESAKMIFKEEVTNKKPNFRILSGILILQNAALRQIPRAAFYEVIDVLEELKYCFEKDSRKTIKNLSKQTILRLFATLYFEFVMLPLRREEGNIYIHKFQKTVTKEDMLKIMLDFVKRDRFLLHFIFKEHNIEMKIDDENEMAIRVTDLLEKFYPAEEKK